MGHLICMYYFCLSMPLMFKPNSFDLCSSIVWLVCLFSEFTLYWLMILHEPLLVLLIENNTEEWDKTIEFEKSKPIIFNQPTLVVLWYCSNSGFSCTKTFHNLASCEIISTFCLKGRCYLGSSFVSRLLASYPNFDYSSPVLRRTAVSTRIMQNINKNWRAS